MVTPTHDDFDEPEEPQIPDDEPRQGRTVFDVIPPMDFHAPSSRVDRSGPIEDTPKPDLARMKARQGYVAELGREFQYRTRPGEPEHGNPYTLVIETSRELAAHKRGRE